LGSVQTPNQARTRFFLNELLMKYWQTFGYVHFFVDCKTIKNNIQPSNTNRHLSHIF
jgi:hypothetical protein